MPEVAEAPRVPSTARHYAQAIFELAEQESDFAGWQERLRRLRELLEQSELGAALRSPEFSASQRRELARAVLVTLIDKFNGGPGGIATLAAAVDEAPATVETYEPYLMRLGMLARTQRGRVAGPAAYAHLGRPVPASAGDNPATLFDAAVEAAQAAAPGR